MNTKLLYENIMKNVSRQVKKALNETYYTTSSTLDVYDDNLEDAYDDNLEDASIETLFTPKQIQSIWENGCLTGSVICEDDNLFFINPIDYKTKTSKSRWKASEDQIKKVVKLIVKGYSIDQMTQDMLNDIKHYNLKATQQDINDYANEYATTLESGKTGRKRCYCFLMGVDTELEEKLLIAKMLKNSRTARLLANAANYVAKIAFQNGNLDIITRFRDEICWNVRDAMAKNSNLLEFFTTHDVNTPCIPVFAINNYIDEFDRSF